MPRSGVLLEREACSTAIADLIEGAVSGHGRALFVVAEPGLGKTAMAGLARAEALGSGFAAGSGRGDPMETSLAFGLVTQAFDELGGSPMVPDGGSDAAGGDARGAQFYRVLRWLGQRSASPLALILDDLHWADADSLAMLSFLCRRIASMKVAVVATLRPWPASAERLAARLAADGYAQVQRLAPLAKESAGTLLAGGLARELSADEVTRAWQVTAGNPFLLEQLAVMAGQGQPIPDPARTPASLVSSNLVLARFGVLPPEGLRCAQAASMLGTRFRPGLALELAQLDGADRSLALESLDRSGLIAQASDGGLRFVHPLFRQALYDDLGAAQRNHLHARAFTLLADRGLEAEAAEHAIAADLAGDARVVGILERTGRSALRLGAVRTAATVLEAAARLAGQQATAGLLISLADALIYTGRAQQAASTCDLVLARPDLPVAIRADALRALARALVYSGAYAAASDRFTESIGLTEQTAPASAVRAFLAHGLAAWIFVGPGEAARVLSRARQAAHSYPGPLRGRVTAAWALAALESGDASGLDLAKQAADAVLRDPTLLADEVASVWGTLITYATAAKYTDRLVDSVRYFQVALDAAERYGAVEVEALVLTAYADALWRLRIDEAVRLLDRIAQLSDLVPLSRPFASFGRAHVLLHLGKLDESRAWAQAAEPIVTSAGSWAGRLWLGYVRGWLLLAGGQFGPASDLYTEVEALTSRVGIDEPCEVPWAGHAIAAHVGSGRLDDARRVVAWLDQCAEVLPCRWPRIAAATGRARLAEYGGDIEAADDWFGVALRLHEETDLPIEFVQTLLEYGRFLRRSGHATRSRPLLAQACAVAERSDSRWLAELAGDELKVAGGRRRRAADPAALTPQERRVADLAVSRLSNKEIAAQLYVSVKTVETHLERVYAKLGIHSRRELPAAMAVLRGSHGGAG